MTKKVLPISLTTLAAKMYKKHILVLRLTRDVHADVDRGTYLFIYIVPLNAVQTLLP